MFRIHFMPIGGKFVIQISTMYGLIWKTVTESDGQAKEFATYKDAVEYVSSIGLDTLYENKSENYYRAHMREDRELARIGRVPSNAKG